ncbi:uncharacterized protein LOC111519005 isoform X2 [Drosophila willistoni]|uniref:uncharacterized protein LOC111519005 isoform X2 n=1 Tax=Drosophila willistoni TaxID=7260 RepID=UPI000C26D78A|nr:uncharacterized protein LOC111519005 isoform X2 [Drosophila willistoni]
MSNYCKSRYLHTIEQNGVEHRLQYVENPLIFLRLVSKGLRYIKEQKNLKTLLEDMDQVVAQVPTKTDMDEALMGMERIERFYDLKAVDIAKGFVGIKQFNNKMSAPECLMLAEFLYNKTEYFRAAQWYKLALFYEKQPDHPVQIEFYGINRTEISRKFLKSRINEAKHL